MEKRRSATWHKSWTFRFAAAAMAIAWTHGAAEARSQRPIDISASTLPEAIAELSREAAITIGSDRPLPRRSSAPVRGRMSVDEALARLLAGSGYRARRVGVTAWRIEPAPALPRPRPPAMRTAPAATIALVDAAPITVTAGKRAQLLAELPMNIAVLQLTESDRHDPLRSTDWVASEVEGLSQASAGPGRNRMFLRGIADSPFSNESQSTVAILLDDARLTYSAPDPGVRLVDVERVEVLKGPQGSLHGSGTLGGIYQIVTRRAVIDETSASASVGGQAVAAGGIGASGSAVVNLPVVPGRVALRLVGFGAREPGWVDTGDRRDSNASNVWGARLGIGAAVGDGWRLDITGFAQWLNVHDSQYVYSPGARSRVAQIAEPHRNELNHVSLRLAGNVGPAAVVLSSAFTHHRLADTLDATRDGPDPADPQALVNDRLYRLWDNEVRASGRAGQIDWLIGLSYLRASQAATQTLTSRNVPPVPIDNDRRDTTDAAIFGNLTVPLFDRLKLDLGARLLRGSLGERRRLPTGPIAFSHKRTGLTPGLSLSWQARPGRLFYLRYGSAIRQAGLDIRQGGRVERLRSDELSTIEAGWRERNGAGGQIDLNLYYTWWDHLQSDTLLANGDIQETNAGKSRIYGVEATYAQPIGESWRLSIGATLQDANLVRTETGAQLTNRRLPVIADYTLRAALQHQFRLGRAAASLRGQLRYIGPARLSFDPALDRPVGRILESRVEGHVVLSSYELSLRVENLLGRSSDTFAFGNPLRFFASRQYTPQRPVSAVLSLLKQF
jgi:outer membrane receptor protein involved in Fe transport